MPVTNQESQQCVFGVSILPLPTSFLWDFETVPTVWALCRFRAILYVEGNIYTILILVHLTIIIKAA